jgi:tyrosine-protein phosphatase YwqE
MFGIFSKKYFLADYLKEFVDIHNHILPGIDDGAKTSEDSGKLLEGLTELGFIKFICTPHILPPLYPNNPSTIKEAEDNLKIHLRKINFPVALDSAAEHMIDDSFGSMLNNKEYMILEKRYMLVEMSYLQPPLNFEEAIDQVKEIELIPILAHPERYGFLHQKYGQYKAIAEQGVLLQLNLLSLGGYYGASIQKVAFKLLEDNLVTFLGSDLHHVRHLDALKQITLNQKQIALLEPVIRMTSESML